LTLAFAALFVTEALGIEGNAVLLGIYLLVSGAAQVISAFATSGLGRVLLLICAAASVVLAVLAVTLAISESGYLSVFFGLGFIIRGVAEAVSAVSGQQPGRNLHIVIGVIAIGAGIVMLPPYWLPYRLAGALLILGVSDIVSSFGIRRAARAARNSG
jgi:uncharacterized membrane protein HdeD (DUF308 family)